MADLDRDLATILLSGEIASIYLGTQTQDGKVLTTSDVDITGLEADVSANTIDIAQNTNDIASLQTPEYTDYQALTAPAYQEGRVFYDSTSRTLSVYSDVAGTTLNIGQEQYIRIKNTTGGTIINGQVVRQAVRQAGVSGDVPTIALALADVHATSRVMGLTTADIQDQAFGYVTTFGKAGDVPMNQNGETWQIGDTLFLSDLYPGQLTNVLPPIGTLVGTILTSDGTHGTVFTHVKNLLTLPPVGGWMKNIQTQINPSTQVNIANYTNVSVSAGIAADGINGKYTIGLDGTYELKISISFSNITPQNSGSILLVTLYNETTASSLFGYNVIVGRDDTVASGSFSTQDDFDKDDVIVARIEEISGDVGDAVDIDSISFLVSSVLIR